MFYRRKIILSLLELLNGEVEKLRLQKLLFLFAMRKDKPEYDFVPYKYGCYSFSAKADLNKMVKKGVLSETEKLYIKQNGETYFTILKKNDQILLKEILSDYREMNNNKLIKHTYLNFPFYAIRSTIAKDILPGKLFGRIENAIPKEVGIGLFTIGYEGISLEKYLQKLIRKDVKLLVDVRRNPLSMKFGFSKSLLKQYCKSVGIEYMHIPEVGIASESRKELKTDADYACLFKMYRRTTLRETLQEQKRILGLLSENKRVALTCFEADYKKCHRSHLADELFRISDIDFTVEHL